MKQPTALNDFEAFNAKTNGSPKSILQLLEGDCGNLWNTLQNLKLNGSDICLTPAEKQNIIRAGRHFFVNLQPIIRRIQQELNK